MTHLGDQLASAEAARSALQAENQDLRDEIAAEELGPPQPPLKPSGMDKVTDQEVRKHGGPRRRHGPKRDKDRVTREEVLSVDVPSGSRFKGYQTILVRDLSISAELILYRRERWLTPEGKRVIAPLPEGLPGGCGANLRRFCLALHAQGQVTTERLTAILNGIGIDHVINVAALDHMRHRKVAPDVIDKLAAHSETSFAIADGLGHDHLMRLRLDAFDCSMVREITEAALWGAVRHHGLMGNTVVVSDDAGQFRIPHHALCWVHLWMPPLLQGYSVLRHVPRLRSSIRPVATMRPAPSASMVKSASRVPITRDELKARCTQRVRPAPVRPVMPSRSELPRIRGGSLLTGSRP